MNNTSYDYNVVSQNILELCGAGMSRPAAVKECYADARRTFFKRHPKGALPAWLAFPQNYRLKEHYDHAGYPLKAIGKASDDFYENPKKRFPAKELREAMHPADDSEEFLNRRQVHVGHTQTGVYGLFSESGYLVMTLDKDENPEQVARHNGWRLVSGYKDNPAAPHNAIQRASKLLSRFTGRFAGSVRKIKLKPLPKAGLVFGQLVTVGYRSARDGQLYQHTFRTKSRPLLVASDDGKQVLIVGGRYAFTDRGIVDR